MINSGKIISSLTCIFKYIVYIYIKVIKYDKFVDVVCVDQYPTRYFNDIIYCIKIWTYMWVLKTV